jgi:hypothetical protein
MQGLHLAESAKRRLGCLVHVQLPRLADPHTKEDAVFMGIWPEFGFSHLIASSVAHGVIPTHTYLTQI